jgi:uncharacterized protein (DUF305 family)
MWPKVCWVAAAAVIVLASCSGPATPERTGPTVTSGIHDSRSAEHNNADIAFAEDMIPHHRQAVDMTAMVPSRSTNPDLLVMATHISSDQQAEILTMKGLLAQWGVPDAPSHENPESHSGMHIAGMVDDATLNTIQSLSGPSFDALWMTSMISHHQGAIAMAQNEIGQGRSPDAIKLAKMIISAQQREIAQMNHLLSVTQ